MSGWLFIHSKYICSSKLGTEIYYEGVLGRLMWGHEIWTVCTVWGWLRNREHIYNVLDMKAMFIKAVLSKWRNTAWLYNESAQNFFSVFFFILAQKMKKLYIKARRQSDLGRIHIMHPHMFLSLIILGDSQWCTTSHTCLLWLFSMNLCFFLMCCFQLCNTAGHKEAFCSASSSPTKPDEIFMEISPRTKKRSECKLHVIPQLLQSMNPEQYCGFRVFSLYI